MNADEKGVLISAEMVCDFYKDKCNGENTAYSEKEFKSFLEWLDRDSYQWLKDNWKSFVARNV